jgi:hypothetical protein
MTSLIVLQECCCIRYEIWFNQVTLRQEWIIHNRHSCWSRSLSPFSRSLVAKGPSVRSESTPVNDKGKFSVDLLWSLSSIELNNVETRHTVRFHNEDRSQLSFLAFLQLFRTCQWFESFTHICICCFSARCDRSHRRRPQLAPRLLYTTCGW